MTEKEFDFRKRVVNRFPGLATVLAKQPIESPIVGEALREQTLRWKSWISGNWSEIGSEEGTILYEEWKDNFFSPSEGDTLPQ